MLKMPGLPTTGNNELDSFVSEFISNALKHSIKEFIHDCEGTSEFAKECGRSFEDYLKEFFPPNYPEKNEKKMLETLKALYSLIQSDNAYIPTLIMEYALARFITDGIEGFNELFLEPFVACCKDEDPEGFEDFEELLLVSSDEKRMSLIETYRLNYFDFTWGECESDRNIDINLPFSDEMFEKLLDAYTKCYEEDFSPKDAREAALEVVDNIWHFSDKWFDWLFWDADYKILDYMTIGELRHSVVNKFAGVLNENSQSEEYVLPEDWENSKDFHFINEALT